jgi:uncharacterized membrane protein YkoI
MMKSELIAIFLFIAALTPGAARADVTEPPETAQGGAVEFESDQTVLRQLMKLSREAKLSLSEAIAMAERLHDRSRAVQIGFERAGGLEYRVRTVRDSVIWESTIAARTGRLTRKETVFSLSELSGEDRRDVDALKHVRPELSEAMLFAENAVSGKAVGASLIDEDGTPNFTVVVVSNDRLNQVMLEARRIARDVTTSFHREHGRH